MSVKDSALKTIGLWWSGLERWRAPTNAVFLLYFTAHILVGKNGIIAAAGPAGAAAILTVALFFVFVLPFFPRGDQAK